MAVDLRGPKNRPGHGWTGDVRNDGRPGNRPIRDTRDRLGELYVCYELGLTDSIRSSNAFDWHESTVRNLQTDSGQSFGVTKGGASGDLASRKLDPRSLRIGILACGYCDWRMIAKIARILDRLDAAVSPQDMNLPGYNLHELSGKDRGTWSVRVSGNWRVTFAFEGEDAISIDYVDYH